MPRQLIFNTSAQLLTAALDGHASAYAPEDVIQPHVDAGRLVRVLQAWSPTFPGYPLYYPSRRQSLPAFALVVEALKLRVLRPARGAHATSAACQAGCNAPPGTP